MNDAPQTEWQPIATHPRDGGRMVALDMRGKWHIVWANPELDKALYSHWFRPTAMDCARETNLNEAA